MKYFGTDGVRGVANQELTAELAMEIGKALAYSFRTRLGRRARICLGMDTRVSGPMLAAALTAGVCACGGDVYILGVMPTPSVAYLSVEEGMDAGVVISASHNPYPHNGIKIFGGTGYKLDDEREEEIEFLIDNLPSEALVTGGDIGHVIDYKSEGTGKYVSHITKTAGGKRLDGMRVLFDCANGASSYTAAAIFRAVGVKADFIFNDPDGVNINEQCGSTHMQALCDGVRRGEYDLGAAFDGDADRCLLCDEEGNVLDGDDIIAHLALHRVEQGLDVGGAVVTIMSNLGLKSFLRENNIPFAITAVGDRSVLEEMTARRWTVGGEQSGHVILSDYATTGDGQLTALQFMLMLREKGVKASQLRKSIFHYPQVIISLPVDNRVKKLVPDLPVVVEAERMVAEAMGAEGRINIRPSGTEPLVRVMVEGRDEALVKAMAKKAADMIAREVEKAF